LHSSWIPDLCNRYRRCRNCCESEAIYPPIVGLSEPCRTTSPLTTHDCRHHFASVLLAAGQSVIAVAELLGHENAALVLSTYGHLMPGGDDLARRAVESAWAAAETAPVRPATAQGLPK
jgi:hypothetical protein